MTLENTEDIVQVIDNHLNPHELVDSLSLKNSNDDIKGQKTDINDTIDKEKKDMLNKIFEMYPKLKTDEKKIMEECFKKKPKQDEEESNAPKLKEEIVLEQIKINGKVYYKDKCGGIWDSKADVVGIVNGNKYILF